MASTFPQAPEQESFGSFLQKRTFFLLNSLISLDFFSDTLPPPALAVIHRRASRRAGLRRSGIFGLHATYLQLCEAGRIRSPINSTPRDGARSAAMSLPPRIPAHALN
jgi:hypothetical protein